MNELKMCLNNFPLIGENGYARLLSIVDGKEKTAGLRAREKKRLHDELRVVEETGTAGVFLFFHDTMSALKAFGVLCHGVIHCSYLCYFLGLTKVNPFDYDLPFERYLGRNSGRLPTVSFAVQKGKKGEVLRYLKARYGADKIARLRDRNGEYILSKNSLLEYTEIERTVLHTGKKSDAWHEDICALTAREACDLRLYTFTIEEAKMQDYRVFSDEELCQKATAFFARHDFPQDKGYTGLQQAEEIFGKTDGKFVFQEQFYELCNKLLRMDMQTADGFRRDLIKRKRREIESFRSLLSWRFGEDGVALFQYLARRSVFAVSKAYVIGLLFLKFS